MLFGKPLLVAALLVLLAGSAPLVEAARQERAVPLGPAVALQPVAEGLTSPVQLAVAPDGSGRLFVLDQIGVVRVVSPTGELLAEPFLDLRDRMVSLTAGFDERGLLGLAFHPEYATNGRLFVYYSAPLRPGGPEGWNHTSHVSEFVVSAQADRADPDSERLILQVDQPQFNHNGGTLAFGPDGQLYISLGDGGGANDVGLGHTSGLGNGQDATNLLGSVLRIDVDGEEPYAIPADNPFVGTIARDEIFAYGLRNPYRMSFDMGGGRELLIADVGQDLWEEVNLGEKGANYGWNIKEGTHCFDPGNPTQPPADCPDEGPLFGDALVDPVIEYANRRTQPVGPGIAVIGGHVYRGAALPQLRGRYVFGDWSTAFAEPDGTLLVAQRREGRLWKVAELPIPARSQGRLGHYLLGFGQDAAGEIYVLTTDNAGPTGTTGKVYRIAAPGGP